MLVGCNYTGLGGSIVLRRPIGPEVDTIKTMLHETFSFPANDRGLTVLATDHAAGLEQSALKHEILLVSKS